ncbi:MAG: CYTH domain-containing protein [Lachnospiraceae bacterium]|nr:CYTH domain-containing protein [Lachnospiraceae bacterium]MCR4937315.1 CYTH domain-containing protein [Lachnospiraceae bacterium]
MEIEKKFLINTLPAELEKYPFHHIEQGYLSTAPVVRVRKQDDEYYLTYKGKGLLAREEYNLPLTKESYEHLKEKADGNIISKKRYLIPLEETDLTIELDIFDPPFSPLCLAEVEFPDIESADRFIPPAWFGKDVTEDPAYHNSNMSKQIF